MKTLTWLSIACAIGSAVPASASPNSSPTSARSVEGEPRFNEVYRNATHNSYWVNRSALWDPFASGVQERLLDQLLFERVRALEFDIHKSRSKAHDWRVYHTDVQRDVLCTPLAECLKQLQQFQYALPHHEPVTVVLELKEILEYNFDGSHTPADLDRLIESQLGPYLFRPRDLLSRCTPGATLRQCVAQSGWPTVRELRGKFLFTVQGNWRWCTIGHGPSGWATYATWGDGEDPGATSPDASMRTAFPMESDWGNWTKDTCGDEGIPAKVQQHAIQSSVFLQVENLNSTGGHKEDIPSFLTHGGVIRADGPPGLASQSSSIDQGFQMFETDYPWYQDQAPEWTQVMHAFTPDNFAQAVLFEPGERMTMTTPNPGAAPSFAIMNSPGAAALDANLATTSDWETLPTSTRPSPEAQLYPNPHTPFGSGCLREESLDGTQSASICRQVTRKQNAAVTVEIRRHGLVIWRRTFFSGSNFSNGVGELIRMVSIPDSSGGSCVSLMTSSEMLDNGSPRWTPLKTHCFDTILPRQGLQASSGDVLFVHTRHDGAPVRASNFELSPSSSYALKDYSIQP